jgi:hypothetical protein
MNTFSKTISYLVTFLLLLFFTSSVIGVIFSQFNLPWSWLSVIVSIVISGLISYKAQLTFTFTKIADVIAFIVFIFILIAVYGAYSPALKVEQDPSLYLYRALRLIDIGYIYQDLPALKEAVEKGIIPDAYKGYASIMNGMQMKDSMLHFDFYPAGSYFYALFGMFSKDFAFYSISIVPILSGLLVFYALDLMLQRKILAIIITLSLFLSPVYIWFGRGSFSEPVALLGFLGTFLMLHNYPEKNNCWSFLILLIVSLGSYTARYEYIILIIIVTSLISTINWKKAIVLLFCSIIFIYMTKNNFWIYSNRIGTNNANFLFNNDYLILIILPLFAYLGNKFLNVKIENILQHQTLKYIVAVFSLILLLFMFRDNLTLGNWEMTTNQGNYIRTYNEEIFERLNFIIPHFIVIIGLLMLPFFIEKSKFSFLAIAFLLGMFLAFSYSFYASANSPQLYWNLRRYIYVIIPVLYISSVVLYLYIDNKTIKYLVAVSLLLITLNNFFNSKQISDYSGLEVGAKRISNAIPENAIVLYNVINKRAVTPILCYKAFDFIPFSSTSQLMDLKSYFSDRQVVLITTNPRNQRLLKKDSLCYTKQFESYIELPKNHSNVKQQIFLHDIKDLTFESPINQIYPTNFHTVSFSGIDNGWTLNGEGKIILRNNFKDLTDSILIIERRGYNNPLIENNTLNLVVVFNGETLNFIEQSSKKFVFRFNKDLVRDTNTILIKSNVFIPSAKGINSDTRKLGIDIKSIIAQ